MHSNAPSGDKATVAMGLLPEFKAPEVATVIRWLLRVILVAFLAWVVRRSPEQEEEEIEQEVEESEHAKRAAALKSARTPPSSARLRQPPQRREMPYQSVPRQRRPVNSESVDFDAIIDKMSKPKDMWEVRKGEGPPQIIKRHSSSELGEDGATTTSAPSGRFSKEPRKKKEEESRLLQDGNSLLKKGVLHGHQRPVTFITWNRDGNLIFTCSKDKRVCVWSFPDGECLGSYEGHSGAVWACSVTADSSWLVTSGADSKVLVWEARSARELARIELPGVVRSVEWADGGTNGTNASKCERFVTAHNRFSSHPAALTIYRFDGTTIEELLRMSNLPTSATQVRWADDRVIASAHENGELIFWQAESGSEIRRIQAHSAAVTKFDFSSDHEMVATASTDMKVKVWDLAEGSEGKMLFHAETDRPLNAVALNAVTRSAAIDPPDKAGLRCFAIVAGGQDVRDVAITSGSSDQFDTLLFRIDHSAELPSNLQAEGSSKGHFGPVHTLACTADGTAMASGSEDGCVRLHMFAKNGNDTAEAVPEVEK